MYYNYKHRKHITFFFLCIRLFNESFFNVNIDIINLKKRGSVRKTSKQPGYKIIYFCSLSVTHHERRVGGADALKKF